MKIAEDHVYKYEVMVELFKGGVTGKPADRMTGIGDTVYDAVRDALTAPPAAKLRDGDFLRVKVVRD